MAAAGSKHDESLKKENVTVTVRFRPLSRREIRKGEEIAWYADGQTLVRNDNNNSSTAYAYEATIDPLKCRQMGYAMRFESSYAVETCCSRICRYLVDYINKSTDQVFGPTTTTRQVYDIAAQHVVSGAMEGVN
ncbi:kinesin-like protein KIN-7K, chloroplastic, partial [Tanacetum coccineum]